MLVQVLVNEQLEGGRTVLQTIQDNGIPIVGAFWSRLPERDYWQLIVATPFVRQFGPLSVYQKVHEILRKTPNAAVSSGDIAIFSPADPTYQSLREAAHSPGQLGNGAGFDGRYNAFQDAYIYR